MKRERLFAVVEPPVGGLTRLKARLDAERGRRPWWWAVPAVAVAAALVVVLVVRPVKSELHLDAASSAALGLTSLAPGVSVLESSAPMLELRGKDSSVAVYLVVD